MPSSQCGCGGTAATSRRRALLRYPAGTSRTSYGLAVPPEPSRAVRQCVPGSPDRPRPESRDTGTSHADELLRSAPGGKKGGGALFISLRRTSASSCAALPPRGVRIAARARQALSMSLLGSAATQGAVTGRRAPHSPCPGVALPLRRAPECKWKLGRQTGMGRAAEPSRTGCCRCGARTRARASCFLSSVL